MITDVERILLELEAAAATRARAGLSPADSRILAHVMRQLENERTRLMAELRVRYEVTETQGERVEKLEADVKRLTAANAALATQLRGLGTRVPQPSEGRKGSK